MVPRALMAVLVLSFVGMAAAQLDEREVRGLEDALYLANYRLDDLKSDRSPFRGMALSDWVRDGMGDPLGFSEKLMHCHRLGILRDWKQVFAEVVTPATGIPLSEPIPAVPPGETGNCPAELLAAIRPLAETMVSADAAIRKGVSALTPSEQRQLIESLSALAPDDRSIAISYVQGPVLPIEGAQELLKKVDLGLIFRAGLSVLSAAQEATAKLKAAKWDMTGKNRYTIAGLPVVVGGVGPDSHGERDARITIDLGGDDTYTGRHGAGVGYSSVLIDLGGDDTYRVPDLSVGAGVLGVGIAIDDGGDDRFEGQNVNFGSGIAGVGVLLKSGGNDCYRMTSVGEGFGMFGLGILSDSSGDDLYKIGVMGQGAGRSQGLGWLVDGKGDDLYQAGGLILNSPLFDDVYYSEAQGFGMGFRDDAGGVPGGVGLLTDGAGNDNYLGETYCQAASYWFSLGSLYDAGGHDNYRAYHYAQSSAMHLTSAYLFDLSGDDGYLTQFGAAQGIGHDYGLAFFLDRSGNDVYAARDARPGTGVSNGIGIFIDSGGIDRYSGEPGFAQAARSMMSLGVFVDLDGDDLYPGGMSNGAAIVAPQTAIRSDEPTTQKPGASETPAPPPAPGSIPKPADSEIAKLYDTATGWRVGSSQKAVDDSINQLIGIGVPAFEWMVANRLASVDRLAVRAWARIVNGIGIDAVAALGRKALGGTDKELEAVIRIGAEGNIADIAAVLPRVIKEKPALRDLAIRAAGTLKARGCVDAILPTLFQADPFTQRTAMAALAEIGDPSSVGTAANYVDSPDPFVKDAAIRLVLTSPQQAEALGKVLISEPDERKARTGVVIMSRLNMFNSLNVVGAALSDPRPGVRITALLELNGRCPEQYREAFVALVKDPLPNVARVAKQVRP